MTELLALLHSTIQNRKAEAAYLGYSAKGYFNIRQLIERGESLHPRVEAHLRLKASLIASRNKEAPFVTDPLYRTARNQGRVQFKAAWKKIKKLLGDGQDFKSIHAILMGEGHLTISYPVFCRYLAKARQGEIITEKKPAKAVPLNSGVSTRGPCKAPPTPSKPEAFEPFSLDKTKTLADLA